ncbi:MAG: TolC family protein, partial [Bacteroidota bacterium]
MNFKATIFTLVITALLLPAAAQDDLSLNDAIRVGLERNFDIRIEKQNVEIAELNNNWSLAFPRLTADIRGSRTVFDNQENLNPFALLGEITTNQIQPAVNVDWNLLSIANISVGKRQLEQIQAESEGNADIVVANALQAIILGYYTTVLQERRLDEFQRQLNLSRDKYELQKIKQEIGSAVTTDVLLEEGNYLTDSGNYVNQLLVYQNAVSNLNFLLAEPDPTRQYNFTDDLEFDYVELTYDQLARQLEEQNVDLKRQYLTQSVLGYTTQLRKLDRLPTLNLGASYLYTRNNQTIDGERLTAEGTEPFVASGNNVNANFGLNFAVSFNLFDGGRVNRAIKEAIIREDIG